MLSNNMPRSSPDSISSGLAPQDLYSWSWVPLQPRELRGIQGAADGQEEDLRQHQKAEDALLQQPRDPAAQRGQLKRQGEPRPPP